jgi:hypothetical protein
MIEFFNIFYLFALISIIFSFPFNNIFLKKKFLLTKLNLFEIYSLNIIFILTILFLISFFSTNIGLCFLILFVFSLLNIFFFDWGIFKKDFYLIIFFVLFYIVYSMEISTYPYLEWDSAVNWIFKTINFKNNFSFKDLDNVPGYIGYPHLGSYLWAFFWNVSLIDYEYTGRLSFIFVYLMIFFSLVDKLKVNSISKIFILIFVISISYDMILIHGYQEPLMFSLCVIFMILLEKIDYKNNNYLNYLLLIFCANLILWIKNEGMFFLLFLSFFILFKKKILLKNKLILISLFIFLIFIKKNIFIYLFGSVTVGWEGYKFLSIPELFSKEIIQRIPFLIFQLFITFVKYPIYLVFILCFIITIIKDRKITNSLDFLVFFLINLLMSASIFYFVNDPSWMHHAKVGLDRMLYQTSGVYLFYILKFFENIIPKRGFKLS